MEDIKVVISNFKLNIFRNLLKQSLMVDTQLVLEFSPEMIKSCSFSPSKSFMKLWTVQLKTLIESAIKEDENQLEMFEQQQKEQPLKFPNFNFYILKGDAFNQYLSVHSSELVDLEFTLHETNGKWQASVVKITGKTENKSPLITTFILTTEELISNKIDDYAVIIKECTPSQNMCEIILLDNQIQEIKRLVKKLHKSISDNNAYLSFMIDIEKKIINVSDKAFSVDFDIQKDLNVLNLPENNISFNILKSDFVMTGNHTFSIFTNNNEAKVIFTAKYANALICCLSSKITQVSDFDSAINDATIDSLDISEYIGDDDLPF